MIQYTFKYVIPATSQRSRNIHFYIKSRKIPETIKRHFQTARFGICYRKLNQIGHYTESYSGPSSIMVYTVKYTHLTV